VAISALKWLLACLDNILMSSGDPNPPAADRYIVSLRDVRPSN
jgi:hypothetical protein